MEFFTFAWINDPQIWLSLLTLTALEIVLGIDNLVFIAILTSRLPAHQRALGRKVGLSFALLTRLMLLATLAWIVGLTAPVLTLAGHGFSWRDIILISGVCSCCTRPQPKSEKWSMAKKATPLRRRVWPVSPFAVSCCRLP